MKQKRKWMRIPQRSRAKKQSPKQTTAATGLGITQIDLQVQGT